MSNTSDTVQDINTILSQYFNMEVELTGGSSPQRILKRKDLADELAALVARREALAKVDFIDRLPSTNNTCTCQTCKIIRDKYHALTTEATQETVEFKNIYNDVPEPKLPPMKLRYNHYE